MRLISHLIKSRKQLALPELAPADLSQPVLPEHSLPEPALPEPTLPDPTLPEPALPELTLSALAPKELAPQDLQNLTLPELALPELNGRNRSRNKLRISNVEFTNFPEACPVCQLHQCELDFRHTIHMTVYKTLEETLANIEKKPPDEETAT